MALVDGVERMARRGSASPIGPRGGITDARVAAALVLADLRQGDLLDAAFDKRTRELDARDRRWLHELLWGLLRKRSLIDALLATRVKGGLAKLDADVVDLLRVGAYQLLYMGSVPAYAAIAQTVEICKRRDGIGASKLMNAVLRRLDRERDALGLSVPGDAIAALAQLHSHPEWVVARWVERWGLDSTEQLLIANNEASTITVRPHGVLRDQLLAMLDGAGVETADVSLVPDSIRLGPGVVLTELGAFQQGLLYVQDPGATLVTQYADIPAGAVVADLCAAPGGKALELSRRASVVIAADRSTARVERMLMGFGRLDTHKLHPLIADASKPALAPVDVVLVDVPCTGTGTYRRHPDARWRLRVSDFAVLGVSQRAILRAAAEIVKPGGLLVYSTCSLELEENDDPVHAFLAEHADFALEPPAVNAVPADVLDNGLLRVLPHRHGVDGAFAARLRRVSA
ncbi:MAG: 16S rRNA (cytosine(967)-C(5))-methyltransferase RsmB [Gemmatimonas sp.]